MKLRDAINGYIMDSQINQKEAHVTQKRYRLNRFANWCEKEGVTEFEQTTPNLLRGYVVYLQSATLSDSRFGRSSTQKLKSGTVFNYVNGIKAFFNWCEREELLEGRVNPVKRLPTLKKDQKIIHAFSTEQLAAMLDTCDVNTPLGYRDFTIFLVLLDTGIRVSELCGLRLENIHDGYLTVFGKGSKEREVGIAPTAGKALWKYTHQRRKAGSEYETHVFVSRTGEKLHPVTIWQRLRYMAKTAGVEGIRISPHTLRHTFAKTWLQNGGDVLKLSRVLGHTNVRTTEICLRDFTSRDARAEHSQYSPVENFRLGRHKNTRPREK